MQAPPPPGRDLRASVGLIRRTRLHPRRSDQLYLHLLRLRDDLSAQIEALDGVTDVLDVYCGARPYEPLFPPGTRYVGLDVDDAYGCADVVTDELLPFPDGSFDLCLSTQAFYFVEDPAGAVQELQRVLRPDGHVLLTIPLAYPGTQRLYTPLQLRELFAGWEDVAIVENGGTVASIVTLWAYLIHQVEKRAPRGTGKAFAALYVLLNSIGAALDGLETRHRPAGSAAFPPNYLFRARRPT